MLSHCSVDEGQDVIVEEQLSSESSSRRIILLCNLFDEKIIVQIMTIHSPIKSIKSEEDYLDYLIETRREEFVEYLNRRMIVDVNRTQIKNYLKIEIVNTSSSCEDTEATNEGMIRVVRVNIYERIEVDETEQILRQALQMVKLNGIDTLHTRDFAEFRESSLKFMLNYELNRILKNHPIYTNQQFTSSPSSTEKLALNIETNRNGYIDLFIECLNTIIEFKHIHIGYVSFSKERFIGIENESLGERILFQKRENKSPLDQMLKIVDCASFSDILTKWAVARLASVYKNQKVPFPVEYVRGYNPQAYYFEPVSMIFEDAQNQILNYQIQNNPNLKRLLVINIGKRIFYQFVTEDEDSWQDFKEI